MKIQGFGCSDVGRVREENQDSLLVDDELGLFLVADGMGGHLGGKTASTMAIDLIREGTLRELEEMKRAAGATPMESSVVPRILVEVLRETCRGIYDRAAGDPELQGMGTTLTGCLTLGSRLFLVHVGDSRCYLSRGGALTQLTEDHSLVNEQMKAGILTAEEAAKSRLRNIITRSVGFQREVLVDSIILDVEEGDKYLICSDGLSNLVSDSDIAAALTTMPLESVPAFMVQLANEGGGDDNITVVVIGVG